MKTNFTFVSNWKMHFNSIEEINYISKNYDALIKLSENIDSNIIISPSFLNLRQISEIFRSTKIKVCAQNCSSHSRGSFTGQISAESLNKLNISHCIVGHSEAKKEFNETNIDIKHKFLRLVENNISPILCIGEALECFEKNITLKVLREQVSEILDLLNCNTIKNLNHLKIYIAYEPIWSIGTGIIADKNHLENIFMWLHKTFSGLAYKVKFELLYGGSVNSKNINFFKNIENIDGFLIGKSSLDFQEFKKIVKS